MSKVDIGYIQLNKFGEQLCGDNISLKKDKEFTTITLADGLGSGVRANILSILTSKILSTMLADGMTIEDCVETIAKTLPVNKELDVAYSTFTTICINDKGDTYVIEYDNPEAILVKEGKCFNLNRIRHEIAGKNIYETKLHLKNHEYIVVMSDGATHAGVGITLDAGWSRESIMEHMNRHMTRNMNAMDLSLLVETACNDLYLGEPSDDTSCMAIGLVEDTLSTVMIGPPSIQESDSEVCNKLVSSNGYKIVCGGTTAKIVAKYLDKCIAMNFPIVDESVPPISSIDGIDLVTEGALTINEVVKKLKIYNDHSTLLCKNFIENDGASLLINYLLNSTEIDLLIGQAINVANEDSSLNVEDKQNNLRLLVKYLREAGKTVRVKYY